MLASVFNISSSHFVTVTLYSRALRGQACLVAKKVDTGRICPVGPVRTRLQNIPTLDEFVQLDLGHTVQACRIYRHRTNLSCLTSDIPYKVAEYTDTGRICPVGPRTYRTSLQNIPTP
ncbi:unnamed protein product, partial [Ectocarpus sp. 4 AP-2014]